MHGTGCVSTVRTDAIRHAGVKQYRYNGQRHGLVGKPQGSDWAKGSTHPCHKGFNLAPRTNAVKCYERFAKNVDTCQRIWMI